MRIAIVCGPREGSGREMVHRALTLAYRGGAIPHWEMMLVGSTQGTDWEAWAWSIELEMPTMVWPALWKTGKLGRAEGPRRNERMHEWAKPVVVLGFAPGGPGTRGMMDIALAARTPAFWWSRHEERWTSAVL